MTKHDDVNKKIIALWQPRSAVPLTPADATEIRESVSRFFRVMLRISEREKVQTNAPISPPRNL